MTVQSCNGTAHSDQPQSRESSEGSTPLRTCDALAMVVLGRPKLGAQATSLTQSLCCRGGKQSIFQWPSAHLQTFTVLSQPPEASLGRLGELSPTAGDGGGAQETEVTPAGWA